MVGTIFFHCAKHHRLIPRILDSCNPNCASHEKLPNVFFPRAPTKSSSLLPLKKWWQLFVDLEFDDEVTQSQRKRSTRHKNRGQRFMIWQMARPIAFAGEFAIGRSRIDRKKMAKVVTSNILPLFESFQREQRKSSSCYAKPIRPLWPHSEIGNSSGKSIEIFSPLALKCFRILAEQKMPLIYVHICKNSYVH